ATSLGDQFVFAVRQTFKIEPERFVFQARISKAGSRAAGQAIKFDGRPLIEISGSGNNATDRVSALAAITDVNACRLFAGAHSDLRRGLARRRGVISRRVGVESGGPASLLSATSGANQIRAGPEAEEPIYAAIIRQSLLFNPGRGHRSIVFIARVLHTDLDGDHRSILRVGDAACNYSALFQRDGHGGAGTDEAIILSGAFSRESIIVHVALGARRDVIPARRQIGQAKIAFIIGGGRTRDAVRSA